jgi:hypothetical protein
MRRVVLTALGAAVFGLAAAVGIAWLAALEAPVIWIPVSRATPTSASSENIAESSSPGLRASRRGHARIMGVADGLNSSDWFSKVTFVEEYRAGWPLPALGWGAQGEEDRHSGPGHPPFARTATETGLAVPAALRVLGVKPNRRIPVRPMWGLLFDAAAFGLFAVAIVEAPRWMRRRGRARQMLCLSCGYDLRGAPSSTCPECGMVRH